MSELKVLFFKNQRFFIVSLLLIKFSPNPSALTPFSTFHIKYYFSRDFIASEYSHSTIIHVLLDMSLTYIEKRDERYQIGIQTPESKINWQWQRKNPIIHKTQYSKRKNKKPEPNKTMVVVAGIPERNADPDL